MTELEQALSSLADAVGELQAKGIVYHHVLRELMVASALASEDRDLFVRDLSERVGKVIHHHEAKSLGKRPNIDEAIRYHQDKLFADAAEQIDRMK